MNVTLKFERKGGFVKELVEVAIVGPPKQVNDIVRAIRNRIKQEKQEEKEGWKRIWEDHEEI